MLRSPISLLFLSVALLTVATFAAGCGKKEVIRPEPNEFAAAGIRYAPITMPDGVAQLFAVDRAAGLARAELRRRILADPGLVGLPGDAFSVTIRDEYMRAKLDELLRTESEIIYTEYSVEERRAETIVELNPETFQAKYSEAYSRRSAFLQ